MYRSFKIQCLLVVTAWGQSGFECPSPIQCITDTIFTFCHMVDGVFILQNETYSCPEGYTCVGDPYIPCRKAPATETPTTEATIVTPPGQCTSAARYPAPHCNQYYQCKQVILWWYKLQLQTCPPGQAFDATTSECVPAHYCN